MERFSRTRFLLGDTAMEKLKNAHVAVFGLGGVGGYVVEALARSGIGQLTLVDHDKISLSNINRQILATVDTVGMEKAEAAKARVNAINPSCEVNAICDFFGPNTRHLFDFTKYDYVVDAIDTLSPKLALIKGAMDRGIPLVSSMGAGAKCDPTLMEIKDIAKTHHCPLAHMLRKRLHKIGIKRGFWAVFSPEPVREGAMILCEEQNKKSNVGTISYIPALFGIGCASVVVRDLIGEFTNETKTE